MTSYQVRNFFVAVSFCWVFIVHCNEVDILGPVVQSAVSLTGSLRVISLTVLADSINNILIFFAEKATHIFQQKNFSIFAYRSM